MQNILSRKFMKKINVSEKFICFLALRPHGTGHVRYINILIWLRVFQNKIRVFPNRPLARSGHMVRNKLCWDANNVVGLSK